MAKYKKGNKLMFRVTDEVARDFKAQCALQGDTMQDVLERITLEYLKSAKKKAE
ncbi:MAG: hypothetical protein IJP56_02135 [Synergistaceae bacterium]|nr:hypothetical protein [Synergistaceae bacterium]